MSVRRPILLALVAFIVALSLVACQAPAAPTPVPPTAVLAAPTAIPPTAVPPTALPPTAAPPTAAPKEAAAPALTVLGKAFSLDDLKALPQGSAEVEGAKLDGVNLTALLKDASVTEADIALVASDGYAANVTMADLPADGILGYETDGTLRAVLPGLPKNVWVRQVVEIRAGKPAAGKPAAGDKAAPAPAKLDKPLVLTDAAGRTVKLEQLPQRIVVVGRGPHMSLHLLYMFPEGRQRLVGTESRSATPSNFLPFVDPAFADIPTLDANPNVEQIAALQPDLVIMKGQVVDATASALAQAEIPSLYLGLETVDQFFLDLANVGAVLGNPQRAEEIAAFYRTRLDRLTKTVGSIAEENKPRVLLIEYSERGGEAAVRVPAKTWMQSVEVTTAGGSPVWFEAAAATDGWTVVNLEQIAAWDPDKVFVVVWYELNPQEVIDGLKADPNWAALKAVKNNEVYAFPQDIFGWDQPEPRWILGMNWLATRLHAPRFADLDMNAEIMAYFTELYGMDKATIEKDILPRVQMDVH